MKKINLLPLRTKHKYWQLGSLLTVGALLIAWMIPLSDFKPHKAITIAPLSNAIASTAQLALTTQALDTLSMAGFLKKTNCAAKSACLLGFIKTELGQLVTIQLGDKLGKEQAQVVSIDATGIQLIIDHSHTTKTFWIQPSPP